MKPLHCGFYANLEIFTAAEEAFYEEVTDNIYGMKPQCHKDHLSWILLQLASYKTLVNQLEITSNLKSLQLELLKKENLLLETQLQSERANKP